MAKKKRKLILTKAEKVAAAAEKELQKAAHSISSLLPWR